MNKAAPEHLEAGETAATSVRVLVFLQWNENQYVLVKLV